MSAIRAVRSTVAPLVGHKARLRHPERYSATSEWGETFGFDTKLALYNWQGEGGQRLSLPESELEIRAAVPWLPLSRCDVARWIPRRSER